MQTEKAAKFWEVAGYLSCPKLIEIKSVAGHQRDCRFAMVPGANRIGGIPGLFVMASVSFVPVGWRLATNRPSFGSWSLFEFKPHA